MDLALKKKMDSNKTDFEENLRVLPVKFCEEIDNFIKELPAFEIIIC